MNLYLWILLAITALPLALSFDRRVHYVDRWPVVFAAAAVVGIPYLAWDVLKTEAGVWGFSEEHAGALRILGLPLPEILFFIAVPFSCLFIYEVVRTYFRSRYLPVPRWVWSVPAAALVALAALYRDRIYTVTVLGSVALFLVLAAVLRPKLLAGRHFWLAMLLSYLPFLIFNGLLTAVPIVMYKDTETWGFRVYTIPLEDFFYSFSLLGFNILVYEILKGIPAPERRPNLRRRPHRRARRG